MLFLLQSFSSWFVAALALGVVFGLLAGWTGRDLGWSRGGALLAWVYLLGLAGATFQLVPGRAGFWLETGVLIFGAYALGVVFAAILSRLFSRGAGVRQPEWDAAARDFARQAEALAVLAPRAVAALEDAARLLMRETKPAASPPSGMGALPKATQQALAPASSPLPASGSEPEPCGALGDLALIHGLDQAGAGVLRGFGVSGCAGLARLSEASRAEIAERLRLDEAVVAYWAAQARLLSHGVETDFARELLANARASDRTSRERLANARASDGTSREWLANARASDGTSRELLANARANRSPLREPPLDAAAALILSAALPQIAAPGANDALYSGERPLGLLAPPHGAADDLRRIEGIDDPAAQRLNLLGVWTFRQIAAWSPDNIRWIDSYLAAPGRVAREQWREQAGALPADAMGGRIPDSLG